MRSFLFRAAVLSGVAVGVVSVGVSGCSDQVPAEEAMLWTGPVVQMITNAVSAGEGIGIVAQHRARRPLPAFFQQLFHMFLPIPVAEAVTVPSLSTCPALNSSDPLLASCIDSHPSNLGLILGTSGQYLRRHFNHCSFGGSSGNWYTNHVMKFPSQAICQNVLGSSGGLTAANINAFGLVGQSVTVTYGLGQLGEQHNLWVMESGHIAAVYTDFPSGFVEDRMGGTEITYGAGGNSMSVRIRGVHFEEYVWNGPDSSNTSQERLQHILDANNDTSNILKVRWDVTMHTPMTGDRMWESRIAGDDTYYAADAPLVVTYAGAVRQIEAGGIVQMQHNTLDRAEQTVSRSEITQRLRYANANCCHPSEGEVRSVYSRAFSPPNDRGLSFDTDVTTFDASLPCGRVRVTQYRDGAQVSGTPVVIDFPYCVSGI